MVTSLTPGIPSSDQKPALDHLVHLAKSPIVQAIQTALGDGTPLYLVGGSVREALLGREETDLDLSSPLTPTEAKRRITAAGFRVIDTGIMHGTISVRHREVQAELSTFRSPGLRTDPVFSSSIEEDLSGRDFTVNALAFDVDKEELIDPFSGLQDIEDGIVRAVGDARVRFQEDPLRLMRLLRFGPAQGREIEGGTFQAAREVSEQLAAVSVERIRDELQKILISQYPAQAISVMHQLSLLRVVIPELLPSVGFEQNDFHMHDVFDHTLWVLHRSPNALLVRLAALFHDIAKPHTLTVAPNGKRHFYNHEYLGQEITQQTMERLRFSKEITRRTARLVRFHMRPLDCGPAGIRRLLRDLDQDFDAWLLLKQADAPPLMPAEEFEQMFQAFCELVAAERARGSDKLSLAISGVDILRLGVPEGPKVGAILKRLEDLIVNDPSLNARSELLTQVEGMLSKDTER